MTIKRSTRKASKGLLRRAIYALTAVLLILFIGTVAMAYLEGWTYIDSLYFIAMLVTVEGPANTPATVAGKLFAVLMAFLGVGIVVGAAVYLFGPAVGALLRKGAAGVEGEIRVAERELERRKREEPA